MNKIVDNDFVNISLNIINIDVFKENKFQINNKYKLLEIGWLGGYLLLSFPHSKSNALETGNRQCNQIMLVEFGTVGK